LWAGWVAGTRELEVAVADHVEAEHLAAQGQVAAEVGALDVLDDGREAGGAQQSAGLGDQLHVLAALVGALGQRRGRLAGRGGVDGVEHVEAGAVVAHAAPPAPQNRSALVDVTRSLWPALRTLAAISSADAVGFPWITSMRYSDSAGERPIDWPSPTASRTLAGLSR
jgi:hypothetical protein